MKASLSTLFKLQPQDKVWLTHRWWGNKHRSLNGAFVEYVDGDIVHLMDAAGRRMRYTHLSQIEHVKPPSERITLTLNDGSCLVQSNPELKGIEGVAVNVEMGQGETIESKRLVIVTRFPNGKTFRLYRDDVKNWPEKRLLKKNNLPILRRYSTYTTGKTKRDFERIWHNKYKEVTRITKAPMQKSFSE